MRIHLAAYAAVPPGPFDRDLEAALYSELAGLDLAGLEQPFYGSLHRHDEAWLISQLRPEWSLVLSVLPGTMDRLRLDPRFGLASKDEDGRRRAVDFVEEARRAVERLEAALGRKAVAAVEVHSAPRGGHSLESFAQSLTDLRRRDWRGATLLAEHCDAHRSDGAHDKGFLRIEDEIKALLSSAGPTPALLSINWGRSALEGRSAQTPREQISLLKEAALLGGLFFSGVAPAQHGGPSAPCWRGMSCAAEVPAIIPEIQRCN